MTGKAKEIIDEDAEPVTDEGYQKYEEEAKRNWDIFYKNNKTNFYKDRHYIKAEFKELADKIEEQRALLASNASHQPVQHTLVDCGCGVGNGFYPLLREFGGQFIKINCCDFSPRAVQFVKEHEIYKEEFVDAKVCDLVNDAELPFEQNTADFAILLFVMSAISPENYD